MFFQGAGYSSHFEITVGFHFVILDFLFINGSSKYQNGKGQKYTVVEQLDRALRPTLWEEFLDNPVTAAEHSPRQVTVEAVAVLLDEAVNIVGDRTCIMSDSVKERL